MREELAVPRAEFRSYYGQADSQDAGMELDDRGVPVPGGTVGGSAMLAAGADLTGRPGLRKVTRVGALASILASLYFLVADLGRPERFHHMLRVAKPSSPMSMGTWLLTAYGPGAGVAAAGGVDAGSAAPDMAGSAARLGGEAGRAVGGGDGAGGGVVYRSSVVAHGGSGVAGGASVSAVRVHGLGGGQRRRTGNAAGAGVGIGACAADGGRGRRPGGGGVAADGTAARVGRRGVHDGQGAPAAGVVGGVDGRGSGGGGVRAGAGHCWRLSGVALLAGSALQRFGVFEAGVASTQDPKYVVVPQRERLNAAQHTSR